VRPELVCEVILEWTNDGVMRFPVFLGLRGKPEGVREEAMDRVVTVDGHELLLTNLEKPFWREEGYTKLDLISYYVEVARYLLPHLRDRPQSLHRHPNGAHEPGFFQKNVAEIAPDWAQMVDIATAAAVAIRYLLCQVTATLVSWPTLAASR
jgi:bifunctional non-homologous end joining protein LigD